MNVTVKLEPEFDQFVKELVESGMYATHGEVFRQALQLLKDSEFLREHKLRSLKKDIATAEGQYKRGKFRTYQPSDLHRLTESVKKDGRRRLALEKKKEEYERHIKTDSGVTRFRTASNPANRHENTNGPDYQEHCYHSAVIEGVNATEVMHEIVLDNTNSPDNPIKKHQNSKKANDDPQGLCEPTDI